MIGKLFRVFSLLCLFADISFGKSLEITNKDDFLSIIKQKEVSVVMFYAAWCGYSQMLMPEWSQLADRLETDERFQILQVNTPENPELSKIHNIDAFPTIKLFTKDNESFLFPSNSHRTWPTILNWINKHTDRVHTINTKQELYIFMDLQEKISITMNNANTHSTREPDEDENNHQDTTKQPSEESSDGRHRMLFAVEGSITAEQRRDLIHVSRHFEEVAFAVVSSEAKSALQELVGDRKSAIIMVGYDDDNIHSAHSSNQDTFSISGVKIGGLYKQQETQIMVSMGPGGVLLIHTIQVSNNQHKTDNKDNAAKKFAVSDYMGKSAKELDEFVRGRVLDPITIFNERSADSIFSLGLPVMILFTDEHTKLFGLKEGLIQTEHEEDNQTDHETGHETGSLGSFAIVSKTFLGKLVFVVCDNNSAAEKKLLNLAGSEEVPFPFLRILDSNVDQTIRGHEGSIGVLKHSKKFRPRIEPNRSDYREAADYYVGSYGASVQLTPEYIKAFADDYLNHMLKPFVKSESLPSYEWTKGQVRTLVAFNFQEVTKKSNKHVFVKIYAPWCGHCRQMHQAWDDLALSVEHANDIIIARIDAHANELPFNVRGYPTVAIFKKDQTVFEFAGHERSTSGFLQYLHEVNALTADQLKQSIQVHRQIEEQRRLVEKNSVKLKAGNSRHIFDISSEL